MQTPEYTTPPQDDQPDLGDIKINHNVIASIVRMAAMNVSGVAGVGGGLVDGISEIFAKRVTDHRGVKVSEDANDAYVIELRLVVAYGAEIGRTAYDVQIAVRKQIIAMTGKEVAQVDVIIEGVRLPGNASPNEPTDDLWTEAPHTD
jgi:uncharacterized alkaline shock family protein YloU